MGILESAKEIFLNALEQPERDRASYVARACGTDRSLHESVMRLLAASERAGRFMQQPEAEIDVRDRGMGLSGSGGRSVPGAIGGYTVVRELGEGGFGTVYLAMQEKPIRREVAIKVIKPGMDTRSVIARFEVERQALARMEHPNIAKVFDAGTTEQGTPYFVMELVSGEPITEYCNTRNMSLRDRLRLFQQVCFAVQHAHQKGVIHRDLKPSNILVSTIVNQPVPKVIDFGVAKAVQEPLTDRSLITHAAQLVGTPHYMSPEQASTSGADIDTRSDVYSLGVVLYELLTGVTPHERERLRNAGFAELERIIREEQPPRPSTRVQRLLQGNRAVRGDEPLRSPASSRDLRGELDWIVMRAMEKDPERRYPTANALAVDLGRFLDGDVVEASPPSKVYRVRKLAHRHRVAMALGGTVLAALVVVAGISLSAASRAHHDRNEIARELARYEAIASFTESMLRGVDPAVARGQDTTLMRSMLDTAASRVHDEVGAVPDVEVEVRSIIAQAYNSIGATDPAEEQLRVAVDLATKNFGAEDIRTLGVEGQLGQVYVLTSRLEEAEETLRSVADRAVRSLGERHEATCSARVNLAACLNERGMWDESASLLRQVLIVRTETLPPGHEDIMTVRNNLAGVLAETGDFAGSVELYEKVLEHQRAELGTDHPRTLMTLNNLAHTLQEINEQERAEEILLEVIAVKERILPEDHPSIVISLNNLGTLYRAMDRPEEAEAILTRAYASSCRQSGAQSMPSLTVGSNLSRVYREQERFEEAIELSESIVEGFIEVAGPDHPYTLIARSNLAALYLDVDRVEEAEALAEEILERAKAVYEPDHHQVATFRKLRAEVYLAEGSMSEAAELLRSSRIVLVANFGADDERVASVDALLAQCSESDSSSRAGAVGGQQVGNH